MYRNSNYSFQEPKPKEIDFKAVDRLLEYTKSTHQNSVRSTKFPNSNSNEISKPNTARPDSLTQRISHYESSQQQIRDRLSFKDIDFCQIVMFLMASEIERLRESLNDRESSESMQKNFEGMQSSINQWRLKFDQKEEECNQLREELIRQKQYNKGEYESKIETLYLQIEQLTNENNKNEQARALLSEEIGQLKKLIEQKNYLLEQNDVTMQKMKDELNSQQDNKYSYLIEELHNEIENLQQNYKNLYSDYQQYKFGQSQMMEQQTQAAYSQIQSQQKPQLYQSGKDQEINLLNTLIQQLQNENTKLKDELFKQSRRVETWCC